MQLSDRIPGVRLITIGWAVTIVVWVVLEGGLWATVIAALLSGMTFLAHLAKRVLAGRKLALGSWLLVTAVFGALLGLGTALLALLLMAVKTGLHAHGPEFSAEEVNWVLQQVPLWTVVGLLVGLGLGLLLKAISAQSD